MVTGDGLNEATLVQIQISVYRFVPPPFPQNKVGVNYQGYLLSGVCYSILFWGEGGLDFQTGAPPDASVA